MTFGRTPLIGLSPNKTLEGFIGGAILTCLFTIKFSDVVFSSQHNMCSTTHLVLEPFELPVCEIDPLFVRREYEMPYQILGFNSFMSSPA